MQKNLFLKRWFFQGIIVILPVIVTALVLFYGIFYADLTLKLVMSWVPWALPIPLIPGLGLFVVIASITLVGAFAESWIVNHLLTWFNKLMDKLPVIRNIYSTVLKVAQNTLGSYENFSSVVIVEFPRDGMYSLAFKTGKTTKEIANELGEEILINVFIPTSPVPTTGFYLMIPASKVRETSLTPEKAFKLIISAGIVKDD